MRFWILPFLLGFTPLSFADVGLSELWSTSGLRTPESVLMIGEGPEGFLLVSQIEGSATEKDGKGGIAKMSLAGEIIDADWLSGLNAPKGLATHDGKLIVTDIDEVLIIDLASAVIEKRITVDGAVFLNDVAVDDKSAIYVTDTRTDKVHRIHKGAVEDYLTEVPGANGITYANDRLYVAGNDTLWQIEKAGSKTAIAAGFAENADGLEQIAEDTFIVSCWAGLVYLVKEGKLKLLLDTREEQKNTADIGWNPRENIVYIPTFSANSVAAYTLTDEGGF